MQYERSQSVTLFTYALSPFGMKVYWALVFKEVDFNLQYVSPRDQREINFTGQKIVPIVKIGDEWKQDSGTACCWLDTVFPDKVIAGNSDADRDAIRAADQWVTRNIIGLSFRSIVDDETAFSTFRNGRILANTMRNTSGGVPWWTQYVWSRMLRGVDFVNNEANHVDRTISMFECRARILRDLETRLEPTGFIAGTSTPSFADISIFAQLACNTSLGLEGAMQATSSQTLDKWYRGMCGYFDLTDRPELVPGWKPYGFTSR